MKDPYQIGVRIGLWIRFILIIAFVLFLVLAAYGNGLKQGQLAASSPVIKPHIAHTKKDVDKAKKASYKVYIVNEEIPSFAPTVLIGPRD